MYPAQMFDLLEAVSAGATTDVVCGSHDEAESERKRWYSFISLLRKEKHDAALWADRVVIRTEGNRIIWEPRVGGRMAAVAAAALAKIGRATPTAPSEALKQAAKTEPTNVESKEPQAPISDRVNVYLKGKQ